MVKEGYVCKELYGLKGWKKISSGGLIKEPGNAICMLTGGWRTSMPLIDRKKCINCLICWALCPDRAIVAKDKKFLSFDYTHCKGCGICAEECPVNAIKMVKEAEFKQEVELKRKSTKKEQE